MGTGTSTHPLDQISQAHQARCAADADYVLAVAEFSATGDTVRSRAGELSLALRLSRERAEKEMVLSTELLRLPHVVAALRRW